jgi:hypothetical protein
MGRKRTHRFGQFVRADESKPGYCPQLLVVFVHGILGSAEGTWMQVPEWIQAKGVSADTFSFAYAAGLPHSSSIEDAARDLKEWLRVEATSYRHIVFITHSNGGLVVKELLRRDMARTWEEITRRESEGAVWEFDTIGSFALRTRFVVHIAVPHLGGSPLIAWPLLILYHLLFVTFFWLLYLCRLLSLGHLKWGYQSIFVQLRPGRRALREMEDDYAKHEARFDEAGFLRPAVFDIAADSDVAVAQGILSKSEVDAAPRSKHSEFALLERQQTNRIQRDRSGFTLRGSHFSVKLPRHPDEPVVTLLANVLERFGTPGLWGIAYWTIARVVDQAQALGIRNLIQSVPGDPPEPSPIEALSDVRGVPQAKAHQMIRAFLRRAAERPQSLVLTGLGGVGKSSVLREVARTLAREFMLFEGALPSVIPLQDIRFEETEANQILTAPEDQRPSQFLAFLLSYWCNWVNTIILPQSIRPKDILEQLVRSRVVLIFDSVDEFLLNNPQFELLHFRRLREHLAKVYVTNSRLRMLFGIREERLGYRELATSNQVVGIAPMTEAQIARLGHAGLLKRLGNTEARDLIRIPLYLRALGEVERELNRLESSSLPDSDPTGPVLTTGRVMQLLIETLIKTSGLTEQREMRAGQEQPIETEEWLNALTIAGWLFFRTFRRGGRVPEQALRDETAELRKHWADYERCRDARELPGAETELSAFTAAFRLFADQERFRALRDRTVFLRSGIAGSEELRIWHREVMDFLVSRYLTKCVMTGNLNEFAKRGFTTKLFKTAGELLHDYVVDAPLILRALNRTEAARTSADIGAATFIIGNCAGLLANLRSPITGPALNVLFENLDKFPPVALHVLLDGCGYRALLNAPQDSSAEQIRAAIIPVFLECVSGARKINAVTTSAAWCYLAAFARTSRNPDPQLTPFCGSSPRYSGSLLRIDSAQMEDALWLVWMVRNQPALDPRDRSLQIAFSEVQKFVLTIPARAISTTHYLYTIVTAYRSGKYSEEVLQNLRPIFAEHSPYESATKAFLLIPELAEIFETCRKIYLGQLPRGPAPFPE